MRRHLLQTAVVVLVLAVASVERARGRELVQLEGQGPESVTVLVLPRQTVQAGMAQDRAGDRVR